MRTLEREDSAVLPGTFRLAIKTPGQPEAVHDVPGPYAIIGRSEACTIRLDDQSVGLRHTYLQALFGRLYHFYIASSPRPPEQINGWLDAEDVVRIGAHQVRLVDTIGLGSGGETLPHDFDPLREYGGEQGPLPQVELRFLNGGEQVRTRRITSVVTLVGRSESCQLRLNHPSVSSAHSSLLWRREGLWIVDLAGKSGTRVRGKTVDCQLLQDGQRIRIGQFQFAVRYLDRPDPPPSAAPTIPLQELPTAIRISDEPSLLVDREISNSGREPVPSQRAMDAERAELKRQQDALLVQQQFTDGRLAQVEARESKLSEAQLRLAAEWERLHDDRVGLTSRAEEVSRRQAEVEDRTRGLREEAEGLARLRDQLAAKSAELAQLHQRLKEEWKRIQSARAKFVALQRHSDPPADSELSEGDRVEDEPAALVPMTSKEDQRHGGHPAADLLGSVRHNRVFRCEQFGSTLVVTPLGDVTEFHYRDVHREANKVRRVIESGQFQDLAIDFASPRKFGQVIVKVAISLCSTCANRGGRAFLCDASEETRSVLQTMRLLELWPLYPDRAAALQALREANGG